MLVLTYFALVGHLNKVWSVILQDTLVGYIESVILKCLKKLFCIKRDGIALFHFRGLIISKIIPRAEIHKPLYSSRVFKWKSFSLQQK